MKLSNHVIVIIFQMIKLVYGNTLFPSMTFLDMNKEGMTCIYFDTLN